MASDLAFSAPESVSLLRMAAEEETSKTVDRAHERAVLADLSYTEQEGRKDRGLLEDAVRQGIERDTRQMQRLDERLAGRDTVGVDRADATQARISALALREAQERAHRVRGA